MKGYLNKIEEWFVIYDQRTMQDPSAEDGMLPLHPNDVAVSSFSFYNGKVVDFEIMQYDGTIPILNAWNGYAKLIDKSDRTCTNSCSVVCGECQILHISDDCEEVRNWDSFVEQKNAELLAEEYANGKSSSEVFRDAHKKDFIAGYNKAKESYYELLHKSIDYADKKYLEGFNKAKELFKEQLAKAYIDGKCNGMDISHPLSMIKNISFDSWYNDNHKTKNGEGTSQPLNF